MLIDEHFDASGAVVRTFLSVVGADEDTAQLELAIATGEAIDTVATDRAATNRTALPMRALIMVMRRYGRPLEAGVTDEALTSPALALPGGAQLGRIRWRAMVDASGRDYLVFQARDEPALAALAGPVAAALRHLANAALTAHAR